MTQDIPDDEKSLSPGGKSPSLRELYARRALARLCIQTVSKMDDSEPRKASALEEYNNQLAKIDARIAAIEGKPPPVVIGLKPAVLFPKEGGQT